MQDNISLLSRLPVKTHPAYSLAECLSAIASIAERVSSNVKPPFWRKLLGGVSKDHARSITAICSADMTAIIRVIAKVQQQGIALSNSTDDRDKHRGNAIAGYSQRVLQICMNWAAAATEFEANVFGSDKILLDHCGRLLKMHSAIDKPISHLAERIAA